MSLFSYGYGQLEPFQALLTGTGTTTIFQAGYRQSTVVGLRAVVDGGAATDITIDLYDGTTAMKVFRGSIATFLQIIDTLSAVVLPMGWSLRATRGAGGNIHLVGTAVTQSGN